MNTDKLEDALTTKVLEEKGVKGNINGVLDPRGGTTAKERNFKYFQIPNTIGKWTVAFLLSADTCLKKSTGIRG